MLVQERTIFIWHGVHGGLKRAYSEGHNFSILGCLELYF